MELFEYCGALLSAMIRCANSFELVLCLAVSGAGRVSRQQHAPEWIKGIISDTGGMIRCRRDQRRVVLRCRSSGRYKNFGHDDSVGVSVTREAL